MSFSMIWPIGLIVLSNTVYHICSKQTPDTVHPLASLNVTYVVGAVVSAILYFLMQPGANLLREVKQTNWTTYVLGIAIVGLEAGNLFMYRNGWNISTGQLTQSTILSIALVIIGRLAYGEAITPTRIAGIVLCMAGVFLISK